VSTLVSPINFIVSSALKQVFDFWLNSCVVVDADNTTQKNKIENKKLIAIKY
jgi:hypothetical protein